tara:strand:+ start:868 stop:2064 length:1197 start_codon:yes stop_codon:yes gene_type:complete
MIINIKYLIFIVIFLFLNFSLKLSSKVKNILSYKRSNIFLVILLLLFNKNQVENFFIYFTFLLILNNEKYCENFSDVNNLNTEKGNKQKELHDLITYVIPPLEEDLKQKKITYENDTTEISKLEYQIENLKITNDIIIDINKLNTRRKKAIIDNLDVVKNNLPSKIEVINKDITSTTNTINSSQEEVNKLEKLIIDTGVNATDKKLILKKEKTKETALTNDVEQINENLEIENNPERKVTIQNDLDEKKKLLENQESLVSSISSYIEDETSTNKDLKLELNTAKIELDKNKVKLELLKELKIDLENRISNANSICDDKFKNLKSILTEASNNYVKSLTDNDKNIATLNKTLIEINTKNKELSDEISKMEEELSTKQETKSTLTQQIQDLELQIRDLEN